MELRANRGQLAISRRLLDRLGAGAARSTGAIERAEASGGLGPQWICCDESRSGVRELLAGWRIPVHHPRGTRAREFEGRRDRLLELEKRLIGRDGPFGDE